jgi:predicted branched-subunit amino acid permease
MIKILKALSSDFSIATIVTVIILGVYLIDTVTPLGEPVWLLYFIPLVVSFWSERNYAIPVVCAVTILFLIAGFFLSPQGIVVSHAILLRFIFSLVFISVSTILWTIRRRQTL